MPSAKDVNPLDSGLMMALVAPPGFGKSTFISQASSQLGLKTYVALSPARELITYSGIANVEYDIFEDPEWVPALGMKKAEGWMAALKALYAKRESDHKVVGVDSGNCLLDLCQNYTLSKYNVGDFAQLEGTKNGKFGFWADYKNYARQLFNVLGAVRSSGKHVIVTFHQDVREVEGAGTVRESFNNKGEKILEWDEGKVPAVLGSIRDEIAGKFDVFAFMERDVLGDKSNHFLRVKPTNTAWAKTAAPIFDKPRVQADFKFVLDSVAAYVKKQRAA